MRRGEAFSRHDLQAWIAPIQPDGEDLAAGEDSGDRHEDVQEGLHRPITSERRGIGTSNASPEAKEKAPAWQAGAL